LDAKKINSAQKKITLNPGDNVINFPYQSPSSFLRIRYSLSIPAYNYTAKWNDEYGYIDVKYKPGQPVVAYKAKEQFSPAQLGQQNLQGLARRKNESE
jgi:hypothetical protein